MVTLSFYVDHALWGLRPLGYHLSNLAMHLAATLFCFGIALKILGRRFPAYAAAGLFALHPAHTQALAWASARTDLLATAFAAAAVWSQLRFSASARWRDLAFVQAAVALALLSKEALVILPALLLLTALLYRGRPVRFAGPLLALVITVGYLALRHHAIGGVAVPPHPVAHGLGVHDVLQNLIVGVVAYLAELVLFVPADPVVTYPFWIQHPLAVIALAAVVLGLLTTTLRSGRRRRALWFAVGWMALTLLPMLIVSVGEHLVYLPSLGYCILVANRLPHCFRVLDSPARRAFVVTAFVVALVHEGKVLAHRSLSVSARRVLDDAIHEVDRNPRAGQLCLIDVPQVAVLGLPHAIRLLRPARNLDVELLSIAPRFAVNPKAPRAVVSRPAAGRLVLRLDEESYLGSYLERALLLGATPPRAGERIERAKLSVEVNQADGSHLHAFEVDFVDADDGHRIILQGRGDRMERIAL
jgi:hypothetical protein